MIDQAFDQMSVDDLTAYLQSLPSPSVPAGLGSQASRTPSTDGARTPHRGSPRLSSSGARSPPSWGSARLLAAAGAGGGGGGSGGSGGSRSSTPRGRPGGGEEEDEDDDDDPPRCHGLHPDPHNKAPLKVPGPQEDRLEPWDKRIYNDVYGC